jgi:hypothetical protein
MINLLGLWLLLFGLLVGWGLSLIWALQQFGRGAFSGSLTVFQTLWLGFAGLLAFLQLASLVLPIATPAAILAWLPAVFGFAVQRRAVLHHVKEIRKRRRASILLAVIIFLIAVLVGWAAWDRVLLYDTGLYHLQVVRWSTRYSVVPGLANLHTRFGYNNSVHLFGAFTDALWEGAAAHVANGFLLCVALAQSFTEILTASTPRRRRRQVFCMAMLPFFLVKLWTTIEVSSLSSDLPLAVFSFALVLELLSMPPVSIRRAPLLIVVFLSLGAVASTTKLGGGSLLAVSCVFAFFVLRRGTNRRTLALTLTLPCALLLGWLVRGVVMSGWVVYPVFGRLPVSWAVPEDVAHVDLANIRSWARIFGKGPEEVFGHGFWHWFSPWLETFRVSHEFVLLVAASALVAWRIAYGSRPSKCAHRGAEWFAVAACIAGMAQWFIAAPDLRYGGFLFWLLTGALIAPLLAPAMQDITQRAIVLMLALVFMVWSGAFSFHQFTPPKLWGRPIAPPRNATDLINTGAGTQVYVPTTGDQCFDAELPCSPQRAQRLRRLGDISAGYAPI